MTITLTQQQQRWLQEAVAAGRYGSVEEAAREIIDRFIEVEDGPLSWAQPLIEEARDAAVGGDTISAGEFRDRMAQRLRLIQSQ